MLEIFNKIELLIPIEKLLVNNFDAAEMHPVKLEEDEDGMKFFEQCEEDEDPTFFSVYGHIDGQGLACIADCTDKDTAERFRLWVETYLLGAAA